MPQVTIIAGANGSGKSTVAPYLLPRQMVYLNADEFAKELKTGGAVNADIAAGRLLLERWETLTKARADFAVETTLATRSFAPRLKAMQSAGYHFQLIFLWTHNAEFAMERAQRAGTTQGPFNPRRGCPAAIRGGSAKLLWPVSSIRGHLAVFRQHATYFARAGCG